MSRTVRLVLLSAVLIGFTGCGGCDDDTGGGGSGTAGDAISQDGATGDGGTATATGDGGTATATGGDGGTATANDGGTSGDGGTTGSTQCTGTQTWCDGSCVSTRINADHCGSCGNACTGNTVCNGGQCVDADDVGCPAETTQCGNSCVDTDTDPDHCGSCGNSCPSGEGCANGSCVPKVDVGDAPAKCQGPDPEINIGFKSGNTKKKCKGQVAKTTFLWGMCSCENVRLRNNYLFDAFDSQAGPYKQGGYGGGLGSNGSVNADKGQIFGALYVSGGSGIQLNNTLKLYQQLHAGGPINFPAPSSTFHEDAFVDGDLNKPMGDKVTFEKTLTVPSNHSISNRVEANNVKRQSVNVSNPCTRCDPSNRIPVETIVKNHVNNNDNSKINLDANALNQPGSSTVLELPCGKYYLNKVDISQNTVIRATGITALFIDGDVIADGALTVRAAPGAEIDVFVNGEFTATSNDARIGAPSFPAANRFYVNGGWESRNDTSLGAYIYSIPGGVTLKNNLEVYGGIYTQNLETKLNTNNNLAIHFDREVLDADKTCDDPDDGDGGDAADGGTSGGDGGGSTSDGGSTGDDGGSSCTQRGESCSSDGECCSSLLCSNGTCGSLCAQSGESCSADGDCCDPLVCDNGTCTTSSCKNLYESCSSDSECCSGSCQGGYCGSG